MRAFWALCVKEWKDCQYLFNVLCIGLVALTLYGWYNFDPEFKAGSGKQVILNWVPFILGGAVSFFAPAFLLARQFSSEWKSETHYLWFSLPVKRWMTVVSKLTVAGGVGVVLMVFASGNFLAISLIHFGGWDGFGEFMERVPTLSWGELGFGVLDVFVVSVLPVLIYLSFSLALVAAMEGVKFTVYRYRGLVALVFLGSVVYIYARFFGTVIDSLQFLGRYKPDTFWQSGPMGNGVEVAMYIYPFGVTLLLMAFGLWLFEKRVQI